MPIYEYELADGECQMCPGRFEALQEIDEEPLKFCPGCGVPTAAAPGASQARAAGRPTHPGPRQEVAGVSIASQNLAGALAYVTPLALVFMVVEPYKKIGFVRFHCLQSIFFMLGALLVTVALIFFAGIGALFSGSGVMSVLRPLVNLGIFTVWLLLIYKAYRGEMFQLPLIGDIAASKL